MIKYTTIFLTTLFFSFYGCSSYNDTEYIPTFSGDIEDNSSWYDDINYDVTVMNISISNPNSSQCAPYDDMNSSLRACTLEDINNDINPDDAYEPKLNVFMSTDSFSNDISEPNAVFKIKGGYSRNSAQKSYSLKLNSKDNLFLKQRKFSLTKSQSDRSRIKNRLAFDLFRTIPNLPSIKMQFINLYINDIDYGLFSHIEAPREEYLVNRGWNKDDNIYNANNFYFKNYGELSVDSSGMPVNEEVFNTVLEIKNGDNHSMLTKMLKAVNSDANIDEVIKKYFNRDNYIKWLAVNLILGNKDTVHHNYYLYNPKYSSIFYFMPWDYDGAWSAPRYLSKYEYGISLWWEVPLHRKFLSIKKNRDDLYAMADEIRKKYMSTEIIEKNLELYKASVRPFQSRLPDSENNSDNSWFAAINDLAPKTQENIDLYKSIIGHPMPFRLSIVDTGIKWEESIDLEEDEIVYDLYIADNPDFINPIVHKTGLKVYEHNIVFEPGKYYIKVISREINNSTHYQLTYDKIKVNDMHYYGVYEHIVNEVR